MVELKAVTAGYGKRTVLHGVDLRARAGEVTTIIGRNGCGKSTLLKTIVRAAEQTAGEIYIGEQPIRRLTSRQLAQSVAYLPQSRHVPDITVGRLVLHGRFPHLSYPRRYEKKDRSIAEAAMERMGVAELAEHPLAELSGGQRQKVYIAMALAQQTPVVILDEPTTYLDIGHRVAFAALARELAADGKAVLVVVHDILLALKLSDRIYALEDGRVVGCGTPEQLLHDRVPERVTGVGVGAVMTPEGVQYYYEVNGDRAAMCRSG